MFMHFSITPLLISTEKSMVQKPDSIYLKKVYTWKQFIPENSLYLETASAYEFTQYGINGDVFCTHTKKIIKILKKQQWGKG